MAPNLSQINNLLKQIGDYTGNNSLNVSTGDKPLSYNDVAWFAGAINTLGSGNASGEQTANIVQGLFSKLFDIIGKLTCGEAQVARNEVIKESTAAQKLNQKSQDLKADLSNDLASIKANIESQSGIITEAQKLLEGSQKELKEKQEETKDLVGKIEEAKNALADPTKSTEEKMALLEGIQGYISEISGISAQIETLTVDVDNLATAVNDTVSDVEAMSEKLVQTSADGTQKITAYAQEAAEQTVDVTETGGKAVTNQVEAVTLETAASAAATNPFTGTASVPLHRYAIDKGNASIERFAGLSNIVTIGQGLEKTTNAIQILSKSQHAIGGVLSNYVNVHGLFNSQIVPVITSIGSFVNMADGLKELDTCVKTDITTLESGATIESNNGTKLGGNQTFGADDYYSTPIDSGDGGKIKGNPMSFEAESEAPQAPTLETPKFEMEKIKILGV